VSFWDFFKRPKDSYNGFLSGNAPIFTQYGDAIYKSDVVRQAIARIASEMSKLQPRQIREDGNGFLTTPNNEVNRLFRNNPNQIMTTSDFLERVTWLLYFNYNAFIYPAYEQNANGTRTYTALYPLMPRNVVFSHADNGVLYVSLTFANGEKFDFPYNDLIHIRNEYSVSDFMGGNEFGQPNTDGIKETVQINHDLFSSVAQAAKYSLKINGILKYNASIKQEDQIKERERFENMIISGKSGLIITDFKGDYVPINSDPKFVDSETLAFLDSKVLRQYNVSTAILNGDFTAEQYQAFYEAALENLIIKFGQAFTKTLLTKGEQNFGNRIVFYPANLMFASVQQKTAIAEILGNRGALTNNMLLEMFGYPPYEGGDVRYVSLNYVNAKLIDQYQMNGGKGNAGT